MDDLQEVLTKTINIVENDQVLNDIVTRCVIETLDKYQQKLNVGMQDSVTDLLDQFKKQMEIEIFELSRTWTLQSRRQRQLLPANCRFASSKGHSTIFVIENDPGERCVNLQNSILHKELTVNDYRNTSFHTLRFPYVLFFFQFKTQTRVSAEPTDEFVQLYVAWRKSPLETIDDPLFVPYMTNLHANYNVCLGTSFLRATYSGKPVSVVCAEIQNYFWSSVFNSDLADFWWLKSRHPKIETVEAWERNSEDPFLFNDIELKPMGKTVKEMIDFCVANDEDASQLRHLLADHIEKCSQELFSRVMRYFKKTKFDKFYPKDVKDSLKTAISGITSELSELVTLLQKRVQSSCIAREEDTKPVGHFWQPFE